MYTTVVPKEKLIPKKLFERIQQLMPIVTVDLAVFRRNPKTKGVEILLIKRKIYPEINTWCLVGGRLLKGETFQGAINRQIQREFCVKATVIKPWGPDNPIAVFNEPTADLQKHFVCMVYPLVLQREVRISSGPEWNEVKWFPIKRLPTPLGFNHRKEIRSVLALMHKSRREF